MTEIGNISRDRLQTPRKFSMQEPAIILKHYVRKDININVLLSAASKADENL